MALQVGSLVFSDDPRDDPNRVYTIRERWGAIARLDTGRWRRLALLTAVARELQ